MPDIEDADEAREIIAQHRYFDRAREIIAEHGVMVQWVGAGSDGSVPFAYTVGLSVADHPELVIFGLSPEISQGVLNQMAIPVVKKNVRWQPGPNDQIFGGGVTALLVEVTDSSEHLTVANAMFAVPGQGPLPALQIIYPDKMGRWPWEDGSTVASEPILGPTA